MATIDEIYKDLTNVDIAEQRRLWDERGKGYYGEYLLFNELYTQIPGMCKILMNLRIPTPNGGSTEIDLLLIHETGLYVFEVKHYKGTIYGKDSDVKWTQYFRTCPNQSFRNPIFQNQYHINSLNLKYKDLPIYSYIVFTSVNCDLRVKCQNPQVTVCSLWNLGAYLTETNQRLKILSYDQIDNIFNELSVYSPMSREQVVVDGEEEPFNKYLNTIYTEYRKNTENLENSYREAHKKLKKRLVTAIFIAVMVCAACFTLSWLICKGISQSAEVKIEQSSQELELFKQKFQKVDANSLEDISLKNDFIKATDVSVVESQDWNNTVNLQFSLRWNGESYGASVNSDSKIIVILKSGLVREYSLSKNALPSQTFGLRLGKGNAWYSAYKTYKFPTQELRGVCVEDIMYIKLSYCNIWRMDGNTPQDVAKNFEIIIYHS